MAPNAVDHDRKTGGTPAPAFVLSQGQTFLVFAALTLAALFPLALVDVPPLVDLPNHLARVHVMGNIHENAALAANYQVTWALVPNLAIEIVTFPLSGFLSIETIGRLFVGLTFLLLIGATLALRRVLYGHIDLWSAAVFLFLYNQILVMGFVNYLFSLGLALLLFAGWIASRNMPRLWRAILFTAATTSLFFMHFVALAVYAVCVGAYEIGRHFRDLPRGWRGVMGHWLYGAMQFLPAAILAFATMPAVPDPGFFYGDAIAKLRAAWSPVLAYQKPIDLALLLFVILVPAVAAARGKLTLAPGLRAPILFMVPLAIAMPFWIKGAWGGVAYSDLRLPIVVALLLVAGLELRNVKRETLFALACAALVLFGARIAGVASEWMRADREFAEFRSASAVIPEGASLFPAQAGYGMSKDGMARYEFAYWHLPTLAVVDRAAFVPTLFTDPTKQPVGATPMRMAIDTPYGRPVNFDKLKQGISGDRPAGADKIVSHEPHPIWIDWPSNFDYLLLTHFGNVGNPAPDILESIHEGSYFTIYRIQPSPQ